MIQVKINGTDYTKYAVQPFKWNDLLDERLDEAVLTLKAVPEAYFMPLSVVEVTATLNGETKTRYYVAGNATPDENPPQSGLYDFELPLIEATKLLERDNSDTLIFLNNLGRTYTGNPILVDPIYE